MAPWDTYSLGLSCQNPGTACTLLEIRESGPENWEKPLGTSEVHIVLAALAPDAQRLAGVLDRARQAYEKQPGIELIWRQECYVLPKESHSGTRTASVIPLSSG